MVFWLAPSRPPKLKLRSNNGHHPSGSFPKSPLAHEPLAELFQSIRSVASLPRLYPLMVP